MLNAAMLPAVVEDRLECIEYFDDGSLVIGSSNLTGRYWNGSLWCFRQVEDAPTIDKCITGTETESGISDIICLKEKKVAVALDSGAVELYQLESDPVVFGNVSYECEHDDIVISLSANCNQTHIVSGSYDKCIKVWDIESWSSVSTYKPAHGRLVFRVAFAPCEPQVFLSCGQDGKVILWDLRLPRPATVIYKSSAGVPTAVAWQHPNSIIYAVGHDSGKVMLGDVRTFCGTLVEYEAHKSGIFRLLSVPQNPLLLASCADDSDLNIVELKDGATTQVYRDDSHSDFIRGLASTPNGNVVTCGWDKKVFHHVISSSDMEITSPNNS